MQLNDTVEFGAGHVGTVVALYGSAWILEYDGRYAACEGDSDEFYFVYEEDAWRDSITDASCDVDCAANT